MKKWIPLALLAVLPLTGWSAGERIVAVGGAVNEIIFALGAEDQLVGNCTSSDYPPAAMELPKVGYQRMLPSEGIISLNPTLVIHTDAAGPPAVLKQLETAGIELVEVKTSVCLKDVLSNIRMIGNRLDKEAEAAALIAKIETQKKTLDVKLAKVDKKPRVLFLLTHGGVPQAAGQGSAADGIIALSGAENVVQGFKHYKPLTPEELVELAPDYILAAEIDGSLESSCKIVMKTQGVSLTPAGKNNRIITMDALLLLGFGPRTVEAATKLHELYE